MIERVVEHSAGRIEVCGGRWWGCPSASSALVRRADVGKDVAQVEVGHVLRRCRHGAVCVGGHGRGRRDAGRRHGRHGCCRRRGRGAVLQVSLQRAVVVRERGSGRVRRGRCRPVQVEVDAVLLRLGPEERVVGRAADAGAAIGFGAAVLRVQSLVCVMLMMLLLLLLLLWMRPRRGR